MGRNYKIIALLFFVIAAFLRLLLWWYNPSGNFFDDHFEPIFLIMQNGTIPAKDACMQCYHPPVFYWISAMIGNLANKLGAEFLTITKILQFLCCLYGIMTVGLVYLIINKIQLPDFSKLLAFGTVCFLPRHIYMSAINSNDTISYLFVAICLYLLLLAIERQFSAAILVALSICMTLTIFTKYTALVILPVAFTVLGWAWRRGIGLDGKKLAGSLFLALALPVMVLGAYSFANIKYYGNPLPWNLQLHDPTASQPRDQGPVSFFTFKPWECIATPILAPGHLTSFWTLLYGGMWFDTEPKFLCFMNAEQEWWEQYYCWIRGEKPFPGGGLALSGFSAFSGSVLLTLGLLPLIFVGLGGFFYLRGRGAGGVPSNLESVKLIMFPVLLIANTAVMVALVLRLPVFCAMKASYFLNSMPALAVFLGLGLWPCETRPALKRAVSIGFGALFLMVVIHIIHISLTIT